MKRILIAADGSPASDEAVELGIELAKHEGAEAIVVHAVPMSDVVPMSGFGMLGHVPYEPGEGDEQVLADARAVANREDVPVTTDLLRGDPVSVIVDSAEAHDADLVVLGSRGHGALASAILGSVSRGVLGRSRRPVLVVRSVPVREPVGA